MKLIALGDTHGRDNWKKITAENRFDKVIFIGDYFDTYENTSPRKQIKNFQDIIAFKKAYPGKVILLFGNHDYHYLRTAREQYRGFQPLHAIDFQELLHKAIDKGLMQMCCIFHQYLFVHAGITKTWCKANSIDMANIEQSINDKFRYKPNAFRFTPGKNRDNNGDDISQSPIWVRPKSLLIDGIDNYVQVVGHTVKKRLRVIPDMPIFIDTLGTSGEFLKIKI